MSKFHERQKQLLDRMVDDHSRSLETRRVGGGGGFGGSDGFWAQITGNAGAAHAWAQGTFSGGVFSASGQTGTTTTNQAYEAQGQQKVATGIVTWMRSTSDGKKTFDLAAGMFGTPDMVGGSTTEAAMTDSWDRNNPGSGKIGLSLTVQTRTAYNPAGDRVQYGFNRTITWDSNGRLLSISAETRFIIFNTGC
jgi:hypothetical protein